MILRSILLLTIPAGWVWLVMSGASQVDRSQTLTWVALPLAIALAYVPLTIALAYVPLTIALAFGVRVPPLVLGISLVALLAAVAGNIRFGLGSDGIGRFMRISEFAVWAVAFAGAALSVRHGADASWPLAGYIAAIAAQILMVGPALALLAMWLFVTMSSG
jgi:hypothetical protein